MIPFALPFELRGSKLRWRVDSHDPARALRFDEGVAWFFFWFAAVVLSALIVLGAPWHLYIYLPFCLAAMACYIIHLRRLRLRPKQARYLTLDLKRAAGAGPALERVPVEVSDPMPMRFHGLAVRVQGERFLVCCDADPCTVDAYCASLPEAARELISKSDEPIRGSGDAELREAASGLYRRFVTRRKQR